MPNTLVVYISGKSYWPLPCPLDQFCRCKVDIEWCFIFALVLSSSLALAKHWTGWRRAIASCKDLIIRERNHWEVASSHLELVEATSGTNVGSKRCVTLFDHLFKIKSSNRSSPLHRPHRGSHHLRNIIAPIFNILPFILSGIGLIGAPSSSKFLVAIMVPASALVVLSHDQVEGFDDGCLL